VPKHRIVSTLIYEMPWEMTLSSKLTLSSPLAYEAVDCFDAASNDNCFFRPAKDDTTFGYKQLDLALEKRFAVWNDAGLRLRFDVLNVFNNENVYRIDTWRGDPGVANENFGTPTAYAQPTRTFKLTLRFDL
jgi:hypothetical protein